MNHSEISSFIWGTADLLRSSFKQHQYGDIILPFAVMRRLDTVLEPTKRAALDAAAGELPGALRDTMLKQAAGVDFYNTSEFTMPALLQNADGIRETESEVEENELSLEVGTNVEEEVMTEWLTLVEIRGRVDASAALGNCTAAAQFD